jgi:hypothetical protein
MTGYELTHMLEHLDMRPADFADFVQFSQATVYRWMARKLKALDVPVVTQYVLHRVCAQRRALTPAEFKEWVAKVRTARLTKGNFVAMELLLTEGLRK